MSIEGSSSSTCSPNRRSRFRLLPKYFQKSNEKKKQQELVDHKSIQVKKSPVLKIKQNDSRAESHNFESPESEVWRIYEEKRRAGELFGAHSGRQRAFLRWSLTAAVAIVTELVCIFIIACTTKIESIKYSSVLSLLAHGKWYSSFAAFFLFMTFCFVFATIACLMALVEPACSGSGIPDIKSYLNGIEISQGVIRIRTLLAKTVGVIFAQASGLPLGFEGPFVHIGAIIGGSLAVSEDFRNHREKRDFVACGTAAGISAAFGSPVGGTLFVLEEGASFFNLKLTWRCFFCAVLTSLVGFLMVSRLPDEYVAQFYYCNPFPLSKSLYGHKDLGIFALIGVAGGVIGATFNHLNRLLTKLRLKYVRTNRERLLEVLAITFITALLSFTIPFSGKCKQRPTVDDLLELGTGFTYNATLRPFLCPRGEVQYNELASLYFNPWDDTLRLLFHLPMHTPNQDVVFSCKALIGFFIPYFILAFMTLGVSLPSGLFIPSLLSGAVLGRLVGQLLYPLGGFAEPGIYALIFASSILGGMSRMTISLSLILLEATGNLYLLIPLCMSLMLSRWIGNFINEGIYEMHIGLKDIHFLPPQCPREARVHDVRVCEIMTGQPLQTLRPIEKVEIVQKLLEDGGHNCFPLVIDSSSEGQYIFGTILRDTLAVLLKARAFSTSSNDSTTTSTTTTTTTTTATKMKDIDMYEAPPQTAILSYQEMERFFPHFPDIHSIELSKEDLEDGWIDLRAYCNTAPYLVLEATSVPRAYNLFRNLGMRHLLVVNAKGSLVGILTRHEFTEEHILASRRCRNPHALANVWTLTKKTEQETGNNQDADEDAAMSPNASLSLS